MKMKERRFIKIRTDMYEDIKMKIIDRSPRRDLVHYIWSRTMTLAGKVNREGKLYMSKSTPYTIETLAIEFCRECEEVKFAFDLLIELEMIELLEGGVYIVKNFAKHQNIKVKEESKSGDKEILQNKKEVEIEGASQGKNITDEKSEKNIKVKTKVLEEGNTNEVKGDENNLEVSEKAEDVDEQGTKGENSSNKTQEVSFPILLNKEKTNKKNKKMYKKKNFEINDMENQEEGEELLTICEGGFVLREGETIVKEFAIN
jgi:predicted phage replisome organizer